MYFLVCLGNINLRHVPYETALQRLRFFSLVRRRIRGDLICMYRIMHGLLDFPCETVFAAPTRIGLRSHTFKIHQQRCKTRRRQHAFSVRVVWNKLLEEIVNASSVETGSTVAVHLPCPPCRIPPLRYFCNYSWLPIVVYTNKRDLI